MRKRNKETRRRILEAKATQASGLVVYSEMLGMRRLNMTRALTMLLL